MDTIRNGPEAATRLVELERTCRALKEERDDLARQLEAQGTHLREVLTNLTRARAWWDNSLRLFFPDGTRPIPPLEAERDDLARRLEEKETHLRELLEHLTRARAWWDHSLRLFFPDGTQPIPLPGTETGSSPRTPSSLFDLSRLTPFPDRRPVFILGAPRSGTTAMCNALRFGAGYFGWGEGHLFSRLFPLLTQVGRQWQSSIGAMKPGDLHHFGAGHFDLHALLNAMTGSVDQSYETWAAEAGARRWVDKTPNVESILVVPLLAHLYPQARFLFLHRHPLNVALSQKRKFPWTAPAAAVFYWATVMETWEVLRGQLRPEQFLEIAQVDLTRQTGKVISQLSAFLELTAEEAQGIHTYLRDERPEKTSQGDEDAGHYLEDMDWPEETRTVIRQMAERTALAWGYRLTRS